MVVSDYQSLLNQSFKIKFSDQELTLFLTDVTTAGQPFKKGARQPFSLIFTADASAGVLRQGIYPVEHQKLGRVEIFLIPRGIQQDECHYEAIFN